MSDKPLAGGQGACPDIVYRPSARELLRRFNVAITAVVVVLFATIATGGTFFSPSNLLNVGERASIIGIVAIGQTLVILSGAIDLSVGAIMSVSYTTYVVFESFGVAPGLNILIVLAIGAVFGLVNGILVTKTNIPPLLVTLATMMIGFAIANSILGNRQLRYAGLQEFLNNALNLQGVWARVFPTFLWLLLSLVFVVVLGKTRFGMNVFAVGGGPRAAYLAGVRSESVKIVAYVVSGVASALGALVLAYRIGYLIPSSSEAFLIESIAAVILGGTNINGGEGSIFGSIFGAAVIAALLNVLNLMQVDPFIQYAIMGFLLLIITFNVSTLSNRR